MNLKLFSYYKILRLDHWYKNLTVVFGFLFAYLLSNSGRPNSSFYFELILAFLLASLIASVNYIVNQFTDLKTDSHHPIKKERLNYFGATSVHGLMLLGFLLFIVALVLGLTFFSTYFVLFEILFLLSGILYNIKPMRLKDRPILDVLSEASNNPIRLCLGFSAYFKETLVIAPELLWFSFFIGVMLMAFKRFVEFKYLKSNSSESTAKYRNSYSYYNESKLLLFTFAALALSVFSYVRVLLNLTGVGLLASVFFLLNAVWLSFTAGSPGRSR